MVYNLRDLRNIAREGLLCLFISILQISMETVLEVNLDKIVTHALHVSDLCVSLRNTILHWNVMLYLQVLSNRFK